MAGPVCRPIQIAARGLHQSRVGVSTIRAIALGTKAVKRSQFASPGDLKDGALAIQNHRQVDKLPLHTDEGDVRKPQLIYTAELHPIRQVQVDLKFMVGVGGADKARSPPSQKIVQLHQTTTRL